MGYDPSVLHVLTRELQSLPQGAGILELGAQDLNPGLSETDVLSCAMAAHPDDSKAARAAANEYDPARSLPVSSLFRRSSFRYRCIDLMEGPLTLKVDLNTYRVPDEDRGSFQLITNFGTSEHVTDQINTFRVIHDFAAVGALFIHSVPCTGYFNHGCSVIIQSLYFWRTQMITRLKGWAFLRRIYRSRCPNPGFVEASAVGWFDHPKRHAHLPFAQAQRPPISIVYGF